MPITTTIQPSFTGGELSPSLSARVDLAKYAVSLETCENAIVHAHGGVSNRSGTEFIAEVKDSSKKVRLIPFQFSVVQSYVLEFGNLYMRIIKDGGLVVNPSTLAIVEVTTPYLEADLPLLKFTQSADTMYLTHPSYAPRKLTRTAHHTWTLTTISFATGVSAPTGFARDSGSGTGSSYVVTAVSEGGEESLPSTAVSGGAGDAFSWNAVSGAARYVIYKDAYNSGQYGKLSQTESTSYTESASGTDADPLVSPPQAVTIFNAANEYPGVCTFFDQRLVFARTNNNPQTIYGSVVGNFENMNKSSPLRDDDAFQFTINALQVNAVKGLVPLDKLLIFTAGAEWQMSAGSQSDTVTPTSVNLKIQSKWGTSDVPPLLIGNTVLFVQESGNIIRDYSYALESDGFTGNDLTLLAEHLFTDHEIVDWCYQQSPGSIVWVVRDDGVLLGLTYAREHEVWGWHQHKTDGEFEAIASIKTDAPQDEVYMVVKRTVDGSTVRYIERFKERLPDADVEQAFFVDSGLTLDDAVTITGATQANPVVITAAAHGFSDGDIVDIRNVGGMVELMQDSSGDTTPFRSYKIANSDTNTFELTNAYSGADIDGTGFTAYTSGGTVHKAVTTISGLDHLEGREVKALANGSVTKTLTVTGGEVTLTSKASIVHIGIPFTTTIATLELNAQVENGVLQDRRRSVDSITVILRNSRAFWAGTQLDRMTEQKFRSTENYGEPIRLYTGSKDMSLLASEEINSAKVIIQNYDPVPITVLAIIPRISYGQA